MKRTPLIAIMIVCLSACSTAEVTLLYTPQTTQELNGRVTVADFGYFPKEGLKQNEIHATAAEYILLTEPVGKFVANAVKKEFRQAGLSLKEGGCSLEGEVNEFTLDALGFSADYITDIRYILYSSNKAVLLDDSYKVNFNASKFVQAPVLIANINKALSDNISQLMNDPQFKRSVASKCL